MSTMSAGKIRISMVKNIGECQATNAMNERMEKGETSVLVKEKMLIRKSGKLWPSNTTEDCEILDIDRHKPRKMSISAADPFKVHMHSGLMLRYLSADTDTSFPLLAECWSLEVLQITLGFVSLAD